MLALSDPDTEHVVAWRRFTSASGLIPHIPAALMQLSVVMDQSIYVGETGAVTIRSPRIHIQLLSMFIQRQGNG